jgi:hypothetical protein
MVALCLVGIVAGSAWGEPLLFGPGSIHVAKGGLEKPAAIKLAPAKDLTQMLVDRKVADFLKRLGK